MSVDLTKLSLHSNYNAFKNTTEYTGTLTISGSTTGGVNTRSFDVTLFTDPDMLDISFNGNSAGTDQRPDDGWFKKGSIWVPTDNAGGGNPSMWTITTSLTGNVLTISAVYIQEFSTVEALTSTDFSYRIVDYSVF